MFKSTIFLVRMRKLLTCTLVYVVHIQGYFLFVYHLNIKLMYKTSSVRCISSHFSFVVCLVVFRLFLFIRYTKRYTFSHFFFGRIYTSVFFICFILFLRFLFSTLHLFFPLFTISLDARDFIFILFVFH